MNKQLALLFACSLLAGALSGQTDALLYQNDRVISRDTPMPLRPEWAPFYHGVASGDPTESSVVIWTRVTPGVMDGAAVEVRWRVATDADLRNVVRSGAQSTGPERDYTVKVDVTGLSSGATYYYGFTALGRNSLTGKTKTTPTFNQSRHLKFGVVSCSNYQAGYFNAYQRLAERADLDAVIHLGDYIYEYADGVYGTLTEERRLSPETEIVSLEDYRTRYSTYRLDTSLIRAHQQHPFLAVWDDHESANNAYSGGAQNHQPATEGDWQVRKAAAKQAYFEWMPIRDTGDRQVFRRIRYGSLLDLFMLDTRLEGREEQILDPFDPVLQDPARTILGPAQKAWLLDELSRSQARWKVIGQQVIFAPFEVGWTAVFDADPNTTYGVVQGAALDIWNGYPAERREILRFIRERNIDNVVILTGDFHATFAFDVPEQPVDIRFADQPSGGPIPVYTPSDGYDPATGAGSLAVEFASPSITSANFDENFGPLAFFLQQLINRPVTVPGGPSLGNPNPHLKYPELTSHGYFLLDVRPDSVQADWFFSPILQVSPQETFGQAWYTRDRENHLRQAPAPAGPKARPDTPAPADPPGLPTATDRPGRQPPLVLLGVYPNPFANKNTVHYSLGERARVKISLHDTTGRLIRQAFDQTLQPGLYSLELDARDLPDGTYFYRIAVGDRLLTAKVVCKH